MIYPSFFVFDVESVGLHGEGFAVAGGVYLMGAAQWEFCYSCPQEECEGSDDDRQWIKENVPVLEVTHRTPKAMRDAFWEMWLKAKGQGAVMAAECAWPVEAGFLSRAVSQTNPATSRKFDGPYPLHEIASFMRAAGMDPMVSYPRLESETPRHNPLADARQSARLLAQAIAILEK